MHEKLVAWKKQIDDIERVIREIVGETDTKKFGRIHSEVYMLRKTQQEMKLEFVYTWILIREGVI